jgi:galactokinase
MAPLELARLCQRAERNFVGMPCGIMDQYISVFGEERAAICIDCRSLKHQVVRLPEGAAFVAVNTMVKHELAGSAYKERTEQCAAAVEMVAAGTRASKACATSRRPCSKKAESAMPPIIARRARHVVTEDARVVQFVAACREGAVERMGELFEASHRSLQHDYEVSCDELDFLVDAALGHRRSLRRAHDRRRLRRLHRQPDAARSRGALRAGDSPAIPRALRHTPRIYPCRPSWGAEEEKNLERIPAAAQLLS